MQVDERWVFDKPKRKVDEPYFPIYQAQILADQDGPIILVEHPEFDYDHYKNVHGYPPNEVNEKTREAMDEAANDFHSRFVKGEGRRKTAFRVEPRTDVRSPVLSVKEIYQNPTLNDETTLKMSYYPVPGFHDKVPDQTFVKWYVQWDVVVSDGHLAAQERKRGKVTDEEELTEEAKQAEAYMAIYKFKPDKDMPDAARSSGN